MVTRWTLLLLFGCLVAAGAADIRRLLRFTEAAAGGGGGRPGVESWATNFAVGGGDTLFELTVVVTNSGAANRAMVALIGSGDVNADAPPTSVKCDGVDMTQFWATNDANWISCYGYGATNQQSGTNHIVVSWSGGVSHGFVGAANLTNVHQTVPWGESKASTGSSTSASVSITSATDALIVGSLCTEDNNGALNPQGDLVEFAEVVLGSDTSWAFGYDDTEPSTVNWTQNNEPWTIGAVNVLPP